MKPAMKRREMLATTGAAVLGLSTFPLHRAAAAEEKQRLLYFTRSVEYEHSVVKRGPDGLSHSERILIALGKQAGFEVECSKDGRVFDGDLDPYDALVFYSCADLLSEPSAGKTPPVSAEGKKRLVEAVAAGKPFVGLHCSCYLGANPAPDDPYLAMLGGRFVSHGAQQEATMNVTSPGFPGIKGVGDSLKLLEEWYALKDFADDLHVILVQETEGMKGQMYQRPPFPATWARMHGKGRVFYCSMGHREDVWTNKIFQQVILGGLAWALGNVDADITPNIDKVTPKAGQLTN